MSSILEVYRLLCTEDRLPVNRRKDILTALRYLAASQQSSPERLELTPELEATYREALQAYLVAQKKGPYTVRNVIQAIGQYLKAWHVRQDTPVVPRRNAKLPRYRQAQAGSNALSPYKHLNWARTSEYALPIEQWPDECRDKYERFVELSDGRVRASTLRRFEAALGALLGYLAMSGEQRLDHLHPDARAKLATPRYRRELRVITELPVGALWDRVFEVAALKSFVVWHTWRMHPPFDAQVREKPPSTPTTRGVMLAHSILGVAQTLARPEVASLKAYIRTLGNPRTLHNKEADYHSFTFNELERAALEIIEEARVMNITGRYRAGKEPLKFRGSKAAARFQTGLILMLGWRVPMRARNWCEALLDTNLRHEQGGWYWHFEGDELKIGSRGGEMNIFRRRIADECVPYLEEYLKVWRPLLPRAATDRHVFLTYNGMMRINPLRNRLRIAVYRQTGKLFYTHLFRTTFTSNHLSDGVDINSIAYGLNDSPATVLIYNALRAGKHEQSLEEANRRALEAHRYGGPASRT